MSLLGCGDKRKFLLQWKKKKQKAEIEISLSLLLFNFKRLTSCFRDFVSIRKVGNYRAHNFMMDVFNAVFLQVYHFALTLSEISLTSLSPMTNWQK